MKKMAITTSPPGGAFLKGGTNKMHSWSGTGTQEPGQSAQQGSGPKRGIAPKAGGPNAGFYSASTTNKFGAGPQTPGQSGPSGAREDGFAKGGTTSMHGNTGSRVAVPGQSSQQ
jgi:hypothetical protein